MVFDAAPPRAASRSAAAPTRPADARRRRLLVAFASAFVASGGDAADAGHVHHLFILLHGRVPRVKQTPPLLHLPVEAALGTHLLGVRRARMFIFVARPPGLGNQLDIPRVPERVVPEVDLLLAHLQTTRVVLLGLRRDERASLLLGARRVFVVVVVELEKSLLLGDGDDLVERLVVGFIPGARGMGCIASARLGSPRGIVPEPLGGSVVRGTVPRTRSSRASSASVVASRATVPAFPVPPAGGSPAVVAAPIEIA